MADFLEKWKEHKDKTLLQEFTRFDKEELLTNGDDFSISYELEMLSREAIDAESGEIIDGYEDGEDEWSGYTDVSGMSSRQQARFFLYEDSLQEDAEQRDADDELFRNLIDVNLEIELPRVLCSLIAMMKTGGNEEDDVSITEFEVSVFAISSYLSNPLNEDARSKLLGYAKDDESKKLFYKMVRDFNMDRPEVTGTGEIKFPAEDFNPSFENAVKELFGLRDDWNIDQERMASDSDEPIGEFFDYLYGEGILQAEIEEIKKVCGLIYHSKRPNLWQLVDVPKTRIDRISENNFISLNLNIAIAQLALIAESKIENVLDYLLESFEYSDYNIDLFEYHAYDSFQGIYPEVERESSGSGVNAFEKYLPNMWEKYGSRMEGTEDLSLTKGYHTELKFGTYLLGMDSAMEFLDVFFEDFDNQKNFYFAKETGLHTNIGMEISNKRFNTFKALLFLSEEERPGKAGETPFAYKGIEDRYKSRKWSAPRKNATFKFIENYIQGADPASVRLGNSIRLAYKENNTALLNQLLSSVVDLHTINLYVKYYGLNLHYIRDRGYIEFRYPGHVIKKEDLKNLTMYYGHIVKCALDPEYKKDEYIKKLYGFVEGLIRPEKEKYVQKPNQLKSSRIYGRLQSKYEVFLKGFESQYEPDFFLKEIDEQILSEIFKKLKYFYPITYGPSANRYQFFRDSKDIHTAVDILDLDPNLKEKMAEGLYKEKNPIVSFIGKKLKEKTGLAADKFLYWFKINLRVMIKLAELPELSAFGNIKDLQIAHSEYVISEFFATFLQYFKNHREDFPPKQSNLGESSNPSWIKKYERLLR